MVTSGGVSMPSVHQIKYSARTQNRPGSPQGQATFGIEGRDLDDDSARLGVDLRLVTRGGFTAGLNVNSLIGPNSRTAAGQLELGWRF